MEENLKEFDFGIDDIGVFLMESITTGLYKNPMNVLREYISNEIDNNPPPSEINLKIELNKVLIAGNGPGMDFEGIRNAVKVGFSPKDLHKNIGFRGIGIYAGVAICNKIVITTKKRESTDYYQIVIDCEGLKDDIKQRSRISLIDSLKKNIKWSKISAPKTQVKTFGTVVELIDILEDFNEILDETKVKRYLEMTSPLEFDLDFPYKKKIDDYLKQHLGNEYVTVKIKVRGEPIYRAPKYISLDPPKFGIINDGKTVLAYYWICQNSRTGKIDDEYSRGLIYKKKGFTIGDRKTIFNLFLDEKNKHLIDYIVGEIHVVIDELLPNTERVEFEASPIRDIMEEKLVNDIGSQITTIARTKSSITKAEQRIEEAQLLPNKPKFENRDLWIGAIADARNLRDNLKKDIKNKFIPSGIKKKSERALKRTETWIKINSNPPAPETEEGIPTDKQKLKEKETCSEKTEEKTVDEKEFPKEWISNSVEEMCYRIGHSDWKEVIIKIIEILKIENYLKNNEEIKSFIQQLELKLVF